MHSVFKVRLWNFFQPSNIISFRLAKVASEKMTAMHRHHLILLLLGRDLLLLLDQLVQPRSPLLLDRVIGTCLKSIVHTCPHFGESRSLIKTELLEFFNRHIDFLFENFSRVLLSHDAKNIGLLALLQASVSLLFRFQFH